jgi:quinol monooxygenase YgiN
VGTQAASTSSRTTYAISYIEIRVSAERAALEALRAYRQTSSAETGFVDMQILAQIARAGHFATIEIWADQGALEAHDRAGSAQRLAERLDPIRSSDYDRRPYKPLTVAPPTAQAGDDTIVVISHVDTVPSPQSDAPGLLRTLADGSRRDSGNLRFDVVQHATRANHFTVLEVWRDRAAEEAHSEAPHVRAYRDSLQAISGSPLDERLFTVVR